MTETEDDETGSEQCQHSGGLLYLSPGSPSLQQPRMSIHGDRLIRKLTSSTAATPSSSLDKAHFISLDHPHHPNKLSVTSEIGEDGGEEHYPSPTRKRSACSVVGDFSKTTPASHNFLKFSSNLTPPPPSTANEPDPPPTWRAAGPHSPGTLGTHCWCHVCRSASTR